MRRSEVLQACLLGSKWWLRRLLDMIALTDLNSNWCSSCQWKTFHLPRSSLIDRKFCAKSGTKNASWFARPRKDLTPVESLGAGNFCKDMMRSGTGLTPLLEMMYPAKGRVKPMMHFFFERITLYFRHRNARISKRWISSAFDGAHTRISFTSLRHQISPSVRRSDWRHHSSDDALRPWGIRKHLYLPEGKMNVVSLEDSSSNAIWKYPLTAWNLANTEAVDGIERNISLTDGNGCTGCLTKV